MNSVDQFKHEIPGELSTASPERILQVMGEQSQSGRKQGVALSYHPPFWRVVAILRDRNSLQYIVVDTSLCSRGQAPVKVYGPVPTKKDATEWAETTASLWRSTHVMAPEWPWE